ncbi:BapA prefix-like domain-containing protein [Brevundimonas sp. GN22]
MSGFSVHNVGKGDQVSGVSGQRDAFVIQAPPEDIRNNAREGSDLVIQFRDGTNIRINGYFDQYDDGDQVVLVDGDRSFRVDFSDALSSEGDGIAEALVAYVPIGTENNALLALLGVAAAGAGLAAAVSGDDSPKVSEPTPPIRIPDKPAKPSSYVDNVGDVQSPSSTAATTDDTTPGINIGTGLTDKPKLYVNGVEIPSTYNAATGVLTPNAPLGEGRNTITITLTSPEGPPHYPHNPSERLVPLDDTLLVETRISPRDVAFIHPGQAANVKITAFDSSIYGKLPATVERISANSITDENDKRIQYYRVYVRTKNAYVQTRNGRRMPIIPGMVAETEVNTGRRTVMSYLLKPLNKAKEALRER